MFKKQNIYHGTNPIVPTKKSRTKDTVLMIIILSFALYELMTVVTLQNAIVPKARGAMQEKHVNMLLEQPVIEDYSTSLPDYPMSFGETLKSRINTTVPFYPRHVLKGHYNEYQYHWTDYAWNKWHDKEFMYLLSSENGLYSHDRKSLVPGEDSWGFCQIHRGWHPEIVNNPLFWSDPAWQLGECNRLFKGGTVFYGYEKFKRGGEFARERKALFNF